MNKKKTLLSYRWLTDTFIAEIKYWYCCKVNCYRTVDTYCIDQWNELTQLQLLTGNRSWEFSLPISYYVALLSGIYFSISLCHIAACLKMIGWHYVVLIDRIIIQLKWCVSVLCRVCRLFPPRLSIFGLFPVLVECHYEFILVQLCFSKYLWLSCVFIVLSVQFDFVWSTRYSPVFLCVSPALSWPDVYIKDCLSLSSSPCSSLLPCVCTVTMCKHFLISCLAIFSSHIIILY